MSDLYQAIELSIDLKRGFAAVADCFDADRAALVFQSHIVAGTSLSDEQARVIVAALRREYLATKASS